MGDVLESSYITTGSKLGSDLKLLLMTNPYVLKFIGVFSVAAVSKSNIGSFPYNTNEFLFSNYFSSGEIGV